MYNAFPKKFHLIKKNQFAGAYEHGQILKDLFFNLYSYPNENFPRLGITVSKKKVPSAVQRNRIKRQVREAFRLKKFKLPNYDIVVVAKEIAGTAGNNELRQCLDSLFLRF